MKSNEICMKLGTMHSLVSIHVEFYSVTCPSSIFALLHCLFYTNPSCSAQYKCSSCFCNLITCCNSSTLAVFKIRLLFFQHKSVRGLAIIIYGMFFPQLCERVTGWIEITQITRSRIKFANMFLSYYATPAIVLRYF